MEGLMVYDARLDSHPALSQVITYWYRAPWSSRENADACCLVRMFAPGGRPLVVVLTELPENEGMSVTNAFEFLAADLKAVFALPDETVWVEHYTDRREGRDDPSLAESFSLVSFVPSSLSTLGALGHPDWAPLKRETFFKMLEAE